MKELNRLTIELIQLKKEIERLNVQRRELENKILRVYIQIVDDLGVTGETLDDLEEV